jgi:hypothetical protein
VPSNFKYFDTKFTPASCKFVEELIIRERNSTCFFIIQNVNAFYLNILTRSSLKSLNLMKIITRNLLCVGASRN